MTKTFKLLIKSCEKFDLLYMNIQSATAWSLEKVNQSLSCCIWETIQVISIKFAGHVEWILAYKLRKFGSNPYYHFWNAAFFLSFFYWRTLYTSLHKTDAGKTESSVSSSDTLSTLLPLTFHQKHPRLFRLVVTLMVYWYADPSMWLISLNNLWDHGTHQNYGKLSAVSNNWLMCE